MLAKARRNADAMNFNVRRTDASISVGVFRIRKIGPPPETWLSMQNFAGVKTFTSWLSNVVMWQRLGLR